MGCGHGLLLIGVCHYSNLKPVTIKGRREFQRSLVGMYA